LGKTGYKNGRIGRDSDDRFNEKGEKLIGMLDTIAGSDYVYAADGIGPKAGFIKPFGMDITPEGKVVIAERGNAKIRLLEVSNTTRYANVTTLSGGGKNGGWYDGEARYAEFYLLNDVVSDKEGRLFICDSQNHRIRVLDSGVVDNYAGSIRMDDFVSEMSPERIMKATTYTRAEPNFHIEGVRDGHAKTHAQFDTPEGITVGLDGSLYIADTCNDRIRKVSPDGEQVTTHAGMKGFGRGVEDGPCYKAKFFLPFGITITPNGNLFVSEWSTQRLRLITPSRVVSTVAGDGIAGLKDGQGRDARFNYPLSLRSDSSGNVYVADKFNHAIRKITPSFEVTTVAGGWGPGSEDGMLSSARLYTPRGLAISPDGTIYVSEANTHKIRKISFRSKIEWDTILQQHESPPLKNFTRLSNMPGAIMNDTKKMHELQRRPDATFDDFSLLLQEMNAEVDLDAMEYRHNEGRTAEQHVVGPLSKTSKRFGGNGDHFGAY